MTRSMDEQMKKILILGAGVYQVPLIQTAKDTGYYTIVSSTPGEWPGFALADQVCYVDTTDKEGVLEIARREQISGICTTGTDVASVTMGYVNEQMGLTGLSERAAFRTSDKTVMQQTFHENGVSSASFIRANSLEEAVDAAESIGYPVVIKCVDSSGSRGITTVRQESELEKAFLEALQYSRKDYVIVEEKLSGTEIGVDGLIQNGELLFLAPHHKIVCKRCNKTITAGHQFPYRKSPELMEAIDREIRLAVKAMGFDNCAFNADVFVEGNKVSIIEIGGRCGATCIPELISCCFGFDYYEQLIRLALGKPVEIPSGDAQTPCMAKLIMSPVDGTITGIDEALFDRIREEDVLISMDFDIGHPVDSMINGSQRIGQFIVKTDSDSAFAEIERRIQQGIFINGQSLDKLWEQEKDD